MFKKVARIIIFGSIGLLIFGFLGYSIYEKEQGIYYSDGKKSILESLHYDVEILKDGNSFVKEQRTYEFIEGSFSRGFLEVEGGVDQVSVSVDGMDYQEIEKFDSNRPEGFFAVEPTGTKTRIEWYYRTVQSQTKIFEIKYRVKGATTFYNDCADYFQKYVSSDNVYKIKNLSVLVHLPEGASRDNTDIWAHGPSGGNIDYNDDNSVLLSMENVPSGRYVEARILMPNTVINSSQNRVDMNKYDELYQMENQAAEKSDKERMINGLISIITVIISSGLIIFPIFIGIKYRITTKRLKAEIEPKYYRDLPSNIFPAELDYLMNHYTGKTNISQQISSTLLDLINKGVIEGKVEVESGFIGKKKDTILTTPTMKWDDVSPHEKALLTFLFNIVGKKSKGKVSLREIKKFCSNKNTAKDAYKFYVDFGDKVKRIANGRNYFETERNATPKILTKYLFFSIALIILPIVLMNVIDILASSVIYFISIGALIGFLILVIFSGKVKPLLTQKGENQYALWNAFKSFLGDFTTFDKKELPELFMWEKYLVYASILGVAKKVIKQLYAKYPELTEINQDARLFYLINEGDYHKSYQSFNDIGGTIENALRDSVNIVSKASRGSGGGFSDGGSDSGGGAGGSSGGVD